MRARAIYRLHENTQVKADYRHVKPGEVKEFGRCAVGQQAAEIGRFIGIALKLHEMRVAVPAG
jgi:hypothetical protein